MSQLSVLISSVIVLVTLLYFQSNSQMLQKTSVRSSEKLMADAYATELLETLRSYTTPQLLDYLKLNPVGGASAYPLCAHVNILDRNSGKLVNRDPIAALPPNLLDGPDPRLMSNRFYQVHVVDMTTLEVKKAPFCEQTALTATVLGPYERLMITVGVSWIPKAGKVADVQRTAVSSVLPL